VSCVFRPAFRLFLTFFLLFHVKQKRKIMQKDGFLDPHTALELNSKKLVAPKSWSSSLGFPNFSDLELKICLKS
jgi:hypothetical protein